MKKRTPLLWLLWVCLTLTGGGAFAATMYYGGDYRSIFLIGKTTDGHHQIEMACDACHTDMFGGIEGLQKGCMNCHGAELKAANDSHPRSKFVDPRNADLGGGAWEASPAAPIKGKRMPTRHARKELKQQELYSTTSSLAASTS